MHTTETTEATMASSGEPTPQTPTGTDSDDGEDIERTSSSSSHLPEELQCRPGKRTSGDVSLLVIEAELVHEGKDLDNPAEPADAETVNDVMRKLEAREEDLRPAWAVVDDE
jgi:hypothetical protein